MFILKIKRRKPVLVKQLTGKKVIGIKMKKVTGKKINI